MQFSRHAQKKDTQKIAGAKISAILTANPAFVSQVLAQKCPE
jgi:hypothetical protein